MVVRRLLLLGVLLSSCSVGDDDPWQPAASVGPQGESSEGDGESGDAASSGTIADTGSIDESTTAESGSAGDDESTSDTDDEPPGAACHPLLQGCPAEEVCIFVDAPLPECAPDASGRYGGVGEPCEFANACDPGLFCGGARSVACPPGVVGCCTSFCDLTAAPSPCTAGSCVPYFPDGSPSRDLANLGYCDAV